MRLRCQRWTENDDNTSHVSSAAIKLSRKNKWIYNWSQEFLTISGSKQSGLIFHAWNSFSTRFPAVAELPFLFLHFNRSPIDHFLVEWGLSHFIASTWTLSILRIGATCNKHDGYIAPLKRNRSVSSRQVFFFSDVILSFPIQSSTR